MSSEYISEEARKMLESSGKTLLTQGLTDDDLDAFYDDYSLNSGSFSGVPELKECDATLFVYCQGGVHCQSYFVEGLGPGVQHCPVAEMNITTMLAVNGKAIANKRIHSRIVAPPGFPFRITASEVVEEPPLREAFETSEFRDVMDVYAEMLGAHSASPAD